MNAEHRFVETMAGEGDPSFVRQVVRREVALSNEHESPCLRSKRERRCHPIRCRSISCEQPAVTAPFDVEADHRPTSLLRELEDRSETVGRAERPMFFERHTLFQ